MTTSETKLPQEIARSTQSGTTSEKRGRAKKEKLLYHGTPYSSMLAQ